jgi:hypothetical protein
MSFQAKDSQVRSRQLEAQEICAICNLTASASGGIAATSSDLPSVVSIGGILAVRTITLAISEPISKCFSVSVTNRATGAIVPLAGEPDVSVANQITVTVDGTAQTSVCVSAKYKVAE